VDHKQTKRPDEIPDRSEGGHKDEKGRPVQIIFNGPVFFGYSADELASLLQHTNLGSGAKVGL
jgi:hypothetical protein